MRRVVSILGATGSIGASALDVVLANPDRFEVGSVVAGRDAEGLAAIARRAGARFAAVAEEAQVAALGAALSGSGIASGAGRAAVEEACRRPADVVVAGIIGLAGLEPALAAMGAGRRMALANKEALVSAGAFFLSEARRTGTEIVPLDSEHNAIHQALAGRPLTDVTRIILTASGGPFRTFDSERLKHVTRADALKHPNWSMGAKITIDSASLMNKGLELIEAHHLFGIEAGRLGVLVHPQSIVHGLVQFRDGSVIAGMAPADMRVPMADCLAFEGRLAARVAPLDLAAIGTLTFEQADEARFPCLRLAREALAHGGDAPNVLNAANEIAVEAFLAETISFSRIPAVVSATLDALQPSARPADTLEGVLAVDAAARAQARALLRAGSGGDI
jgi:1-deoxy-D-xylulose-5-phosphate reductoisomerase